VTISFSRRTLLHELSYIYFTFLFFCLNLCLCLFLHFPTITIQVILLLFVFFRSSSFNFLPVLGQIVPKVLNKGAAGRQATSTRRFRQVACRRPRVTVTTFSMPVTLHTSHAVQTAALSRYMTSQAIQVNQHQVSRVSRLETQASNAFFVILHNSLASMYINADTNS
jgi:hypothetical protein